MTSPGDRFWSKVVETPDGCWPWTARTLRGYGYFGLRDGVSVIAHRWAYDLDPVDRSENLRRGYAARGLKDECAQGHCFSDDNTFQRSDGGRGCRTCRTNSSRAFKARARAALATRPTQPNTESRTA